MSCIISEAMHYNLDNSKTEENSVSKISKSVNSLISVKQEALTPPPNITFFCLSFQRSLQVRPGPRRKKNLGKKEQLSQTRVSQRPQTSANAADPTKFPQLAPSCSGKNSVKYSWIWIVIRNSTKIKRLAASEIDHLAEKISQKHVNNLLCHQQNWYNCPLLYSGKISFKIPGFPSWSRWTPKSNRLLLGTHPNPSKNSSKFSTTFSVILQNRQSGGGSKAITDQSNWQH